MVGEGPGLCVLKCALYLLNTVLTVRIYYHYIAHVTKLTRSSDALTLDDRSD